MLVGFSILLWAGLATAGHSYLGPRCGANHDHYICQDTAPGLSISGPIIDGTCSASASVAVACAAIRQESTCAATGRGFWFQTPVGCRFAVEPAVTDGHPHCIPTVERDSRLCFPSSPYPVLPFAPYTRLAAD